MKDQLIFDTTSADTIADSDSVGAYVRAGSDGAVIDYQTYNAQEWLNTASILHDENGSVINDANPLPVDLVSPLVVDVQLEGVYDGVSNTNPDNTGVIFHTRAASIGDAEQIQRTTASGVAAILAADLGNINAMDVNSFMYAIDDVDGDADLVTLDNVSGGVNVHIAGIDAELEINDAALANTAIAHAKLTTSATPDTAESVVASVLADRKYLHIYNAGNQKIFIGGAGVDIATGFPISPGSYMELRAGAAVDVQVAAKAASSDVRNLQLS
jgi:hypothetical protein